jgi:signal transduction histidine kinase
VAAALENARLHELSREAIRSRDDLLILTTHELRTPMTALELATNTLLRHEARSGDGPQLGRTETVARHVQRMSAVVEHIIDALRIRVQGVVLSREPCDLALIARTAAVAASERVRRTTPIEVRAEAPVIGCWDKGGLERVTRELLDNAVKFGERKPIEVAAFREGEQAVLRVRDHGIEIPDESMTSIFSPFERAVSKDNYGGLGLGLYVAKAIAEGHGGSIRVTSDRAEGTTFVVRLPLGEPIAARAI